MLPCSLYIWIIAGFAACTLFITVVSSAGRVWNTILKSGVLRDEVIVTEVRTYVRTFLFLLFLAECVYGCVEWVVSL